MSIFSTSKAPTSAYANKYSVNTSHVHHPPRACRSSRITSICRNRILSLAMASSSRGIESSLQDWCPVYQMVSYFYRRTRILIPSLVVGNVPSLLLNSRNGILSLGIVPNIGINSTIPGERVRFLQRGYGSYIIVYQV